MTTETHRTHNSDELKIAHFSTVHLRDDSRIRSKMMSSIHKRFPGHVKLFVQDGLGDEIDSRDGYQVIDTGQRLSRLKRMSFGGWRMFRAILRARPKIAHFHDPELIPWAMLLRVCGIKIIYDVHEDYPEAVSQNFRLSSLVRRSLPPVVRFVEWVSTPFFSGIVTVTRQIEGRFPTGKTVLVRNWPIVSEYHAPSGTPMHDRPREVAYVGTITQNRNIVGMLDAIHSLRDADVTLRLAGDFPVAVDEAVTRAHVGWDRVTFDGWVSRDGIAGILASTRAGLVVLKPIKHETLSLPIKLFEYMAAGVPLISSDFPLWREIIDDVGCGLLVDPLKPDEIAEAIRWMVDNPDEAAEMGKRGRDAVLTRYNWEQEADVLYQLYKSILEPA
tara:strand:+ start:10907 stop:12067 length:1161 start_codon:yes stop_codon:yes gene_type:complete